MVTPVVAAHPGSRPQDGARRHRLVAGEVVPVALAAAEQIGEGGEQSGEGGEQSGEGGEQSGEGGEQSGNLASGDRSPRVGRRVREIVAEVRRSDVVHLQDASSWASAACALSARVFQRPTVVGLAPGSSVAPSGAAHRRWWAGPLEGWVARAAAAVEVADVATRNRMLRHGVEPARVILRAAGIDIEVYRPAAPDERPDLRRRHGLPGDGTLVLVGGGTVPVTASGGYRLVQLHGEVADVAPTDLPPADLPPADLIAGDGPILVGVPADPRRRAELYQACDLFVRPDAGGELTIPAQHAMACGLPVVSADDLAVEDYGLDRSGLRLYPRSGAGLEAAVLEVLGDAAERQRMIEYSLATGPATSVSHHAVEYRRMYERVTTLPPRPAMAPWGVNRRQVLAAGLGALVVAIGLLVILRGPTAHQAASAVGRQPEVYGQIFFPQPLGLPSEVHAGGRLAFTFAVANPGGAERTYRYAVTESGTRGTTQAAAGVLRIPPRQTVEHPVAITAAVLGSHLTVRVSIAPSGLFVAFHVAQAAT